MSTRRMLTALSIIAGWTLGLFAQTPIQTARTPIVSSAGGGSSVTCTNQFLRTSSTCASITATDLGTTLAPQFARLGLGTPAGSTALLTLLGAGVIAPSVDSTGSVVFTKADGTTSVLTLDTTNNRVNVPGALNQTGGVISVFAGAFAIDGASSGNAVLASGGRYGWSSGAVSITSANSDTGLRRLGAAQVAVSDGGATNYGDMAMRHTLAGASAAPTIGSANCGTPGNGTVTGGDQTGRATYGSVSGSTCKVTFGTAYANPPVCLADNETTTGREITATETVNDVTFQQFLLSTGVAQNYAQSDKIAYHCFGF